MKKLVLASLAVFISGCAHEMPKGAAFKTPEQLKMNSASHWDVLAHNEAALIKQTLKKSSTLPLYIKAPDHSFPFAQAYHHLLTSNLAAQGAVLVTRPEFNAATVSYVVDVVKHAAHYTEQMGLPTPLGQGVFYLLSSYLGKGVHDVTTTAIEVAKAPAYAVIDQVKPNFATLAEVVITTQITMGNQILNSDSRVYYVDRGNLGHYAYRAPDALPHRFAVTDR